MKFKKGSYHIIPLGGSHCALCGIDVYAEKTALEARAQRRRSARMRPLHMCVQGGEVSGAGYLDSIVTSADWFMDRHGTHWVNDVDTRTGICYQYACNGSPAD